MPRAKKLHLLCILTSKQVLCTPFPGRNNLFRRENSLFFVSQLMTSQRKPYIFGINRNMLKCTKMSKKNLVYYSRDYSNDFDQWMACGAPVRWSKYTTCILNLLLIELYAYDVVLSVSKFQIDSFLKWQPYHSPEMA